MFSVLHILLKCKTTLKFIYKLYLSIVCVCWCVWGELWTHNSCTETLTCGNKDFRIKHYWKQCPATGAEKKDYVICRDLAIEIDKFETYKEHWF